MKRVVLTALGVVLASPIAFAQVEQKSEKTSQLAADWWQWAVSKPIADNPLIGDDPDYSEKQCDGQNVEEPGLELGPVSSQASTRSTGYHWPVEPAASSPRRDMAELVAGYSER